MTGYPPPPYPTPPPDGSYPSWPGSSAGAPSSGGGPWQPPGAAGYPYPQYGPPPAAGGNGLATAALVLGVLGCIPVLAVTGIVLGAVALSQIRRYATGGRGQAIGGMVAGGVWLLGWAAFVLASVLAEAAGQREAAQRPPPAPTPAVTTPGTAAPGDPVAVSIEDLKAGDCIGDYDEDADSLRTLPVVPCSQPHTSEVIGEIRLRERPWPGSDALFDEGDRLCGLELRRYAPSPAWKVRVSSWVPTEKSWPDDRTATCMVHYEDGARTGSLR